MSSWLCRLSGSFVMGVAVRKATMDSCEVGEEHTFLTAWARPAVAFIT